MDQRRLVPLVLFVLSLTILWINWTNFSQPAPTIPASTVSTPPAARDDDTVPTPSAAVAPPTESLADSSASRAAQIEVVTDVLRARISAEGGNIVRLELEKHRATSTRGIFDDWWPWATTQGKSDSDPARGFVIFDDSDEHFYEAESGLLGTNPPLPTHRTRFTLPESDQTLADGQDKLTLRLEAPAADGITVTKIMTFTRGSYLIDVDYEIRNERAEAISAQAYFQFQRDGKPAEQARGFGVQTFTGPAFYTDDARFQKVTFEEIAEGKAKFVGHADNGWVAMVQHYFVSAWLPPQGLARDYSARKTKSGNYTAGLKLAPVSVAPGATAQVGARLYAGPQDQNKLESIAPGLKLVVDYGVLTIIAAPLFWLLSLLHALTGNWGWAIILVTVIIKLIFFPLSATSYKSMAKMRVLAPRMQRMKELYGNDKARMQQEMIELYRTEKINPLGGCLPILVQIPVFLALYWVLLSSVEMRQAPWLGWIQDLSAPDYRMILPILMGVSMLIQTKLNPTPPDPIQAKIMLALPVIFTIMFMWFPSGLVLYWVVNNILSIAQQWQITRMIERSGKKPAKAANDPKA
ncbi:MAG: membrane protein insertase YidC [Azoarcus sp.]|jgi:YidC/Oxa1 family membrane protein insertase|nr:membrane protein insertase YidC [Azoarcus sp.]